MAGSRKQLKEILNAGECSTQEVQQKERVSEMPPGPPANHADGEDPERDRSFQDESNDGSEHDSLMPPETMNREAKEQMRFRNFEKNTFRQPKFWLSWQGSILAHSDNTTNSSMPEIAGQSQSGMGYIVFAGNKYQKFKAVGNDEAVEKNRKALD
ncbi:hypothetical protein NW762_008277 [Fusarium torreyae]|uniref:Uncharacterized protein n=1 Tax=Fusarium torreyae TaxID=1237075 RepID=A0A9W8RYL6_9HYPO|nr:hypothetical protein NW762_008277 [Fusarium torreyae]